MPYGIFLFIKCGIMFVVIFMEYKGAIFDLDGTILDSSRVWKKVDSDFFSEHNMSVPSDYLENISAMNIFDIAKYTINRFNFPYTINELVDKWNDMASL